MIFSNYEKIANNKERRMLLNLIDYGINNIKSKNLIKKFVKFENKKLIVKGGEFDIKNKRIFVIGAGKMSGEMAFELENIIGPDNITYGFINTNFIKNKPKKIILNKSDHPIPSLSGLNGAKKILEIKEKFNLNENDVIIALISGGGSSLLPYPVDEIPFKDKKKMIIELIKSGADGHEMPVLKKKISKIKGGKLAEYFYPTPIISLIVSDVTNNNIGSVASGPLTKDISTFKDALNIIKKYNLQDKLPKSVLDFILKNQDSSTKQKLEHVKQFLLANNESLINNIEDCAKKIGLKVIKIKNIQGESKKVAEHICNKLNDIPINKPTLIIYGGETTVTLNNNSGRGGRNQEFILSCLKYFNYNKFDNFAIASIASDGMDYIKESCGAIIDKKSFYLVNKKKINLDEYLEKHDSHKILKKINSNLMSGLTGVNVGDIMVFLFN